MKALLLVCLCAFGVFAAESKNRDFYKILELEKGATEAQIKKAYRKLSLQYHPDKCKSEECKNKFIDIQDSYDCLSDENKRRVYDLRGEEGLQERSEQNRQQGFHPFGDMFGFPFGGGGRQRAQDMQATLSINLEDLYNGAEREISVNRHELCMHCKATGADDPDHVHKCPVCKGQGFELRRIQLAPGFVQQVQQPCSKCQGKGTVFDKVCPICKGNKLVAKQHKITVDIERGMNDGEKMIFEHEGNQHPDMDSGHIIVVLNTRKHKDFTRDGNNLKMNVNISLKEALLGWEKTFRHMDGHEVTIGKQGITRPGEIIKVAEEGMPVHKFPSQKGDLFVTVTVVMPTSLTEKQKQIIATLF